MGPSVSSTLEPEIPAGPSRVPPLGLRYIRFGPFQVDQQREEVTKNGTRLKLQGKVYQVLVALIEKQGEVVTRDELRLRLWPADTHVNYDANVNTTVNKLRQALGDSSDRPQFIETIPRKGYCLIVHPEFADVPQVISVGSTVNGVNGQAEPRTDTASSPKSDIWMTLGIIGLILGGMLLGAAITKLWIYHFAPTPSGFWL
jgi:DNA-binding winged helix-turn-helix (wHTH) protein